MIRKKLLLISSLFLLSVSTILSEDFAGKSLENFSSEHGRSLELYKGKYEGVYAGTLKLRACKTKWRVEVLRHDLITLTFSCLFPFDTDTTFYQCDMGEMKCIADPTIFPKESCQEKSIKLLKNGNLLVLDQCSQKHFYLRKKKRLKICI